MSPEISIVVPHLNQPGALAEGLAALLDQEIAPGRAEIVVVDNGSAEPPGAVVARFPGVRLAIEPVPGPGPARNRGVAETTAPILAFTDADCLVDRRWAAMILERFAAEPDLAILGGDVRVRAAEPGHPTAAEAYDLVYAFPQRRYIERKHFSGGGNLAMRRTVFERVGPFAGIAVAEDTDWGQRAARMGFVTLYEPRMIVHHPARRSMADLKAKWDRNISHHYAALAPGAAARLGWIARLAALGVMPLAQVPHILATDRLHNPRERWLAFRALAALDLYRAGRMAAVMVDDGTRRASLRWNRG
jgi:glycosyltransferase involved in cell wall biosynthesis